MQQQLSEYGHQPTEQIVFDRPAVTKRLLGDEEILITIARSFIDDMTLQVETIIKLVAEGDIELIAKQAHKIKGSSANMGGMVLSELAQSIEVAAKNVDIGIIQQQLPKLEQSFVILKEEIEVALF